MAINFNHSINKSVLEITTWGFDESIEDTKNYGFAVLEIALENGCNKILIDERELEYKLKTSESFDLAKLAGSVTPIDLKVALISIPENEEYLQFYTSIAGLRGLKIKAFFNRQEAKTWLMQND